MAQAYANRSNQRVGDRGVRPTRPRGLGIVAGIDLVMGGLSVVGGLSSLATGWMPVAADGLGFLRFLAPVLPDAMIVIGALQLAQAFGLWRGLAWAWTLAISFQIVHTVADIGFIAERTFALDKFVGMVIILGSLVYLMRPSVRAYFGSPVVPAQRSTILA